MGRLYSFSLILVSLVLAAPIAVRAEPAGASDTILVSGEGEMNVAPDIAYITFGVETQDKNAKEAQQKNAQISSQIERILKDRFKLEKADVKTVGYNVNPEYNYTQNRREFLGYKVSNTIQVSFRALKEIGALLDAVGGAGVNSVQGIQFDTEKRLDYQIEAIASAMENAKRKADMIAKAAGRPVKRVLRVHEGVQWEPGPRPMPMMSMMAKSAEAAGGTSISAGSLKITTNVTVEYQM